MKDQPLVSIVTPVLNRVDTIASCVRSIRSQTYPEVEHIVVDGGSTDGTLELLRRFEDAGDLRLITGPDEGMYDAINKGLAVATGQILAYLNSDDTYLPWSIDVGVEALTNGGADLVYGDLGVLSTAGPEPFFYVQFYPPFSFRHYTYIGTIGQPTVFWTRALFANIGDFDRSYKLLGDCEYWLRAAASGARLDHVDEVLAVQVEHAGTLRELHPDRLRKEFERLHREFREVSGSAPTDWSARASKSLFWRRRQVSLLLSSRGLGNRWSHFLAYLKEIDDRPRVGTALRHLLPLRWRGPRSTMVDAALLERELLGRTKDF